MAKFKVINKQSKVGGTNKLVFATKKEAEESANRLNGAAVASNIPAAFEVKKTN